MSFFDPFIVAVPLTYPRLPQNYIRSASASFNMTGNAGRGWVGERKASSSLSLDADPHRIYEASRSAPADLGVDATPNRYWTGSRLAPASLGVDASAIRGWEGTRSASAELSPTAMATRSTEVFRSAIAGIGLTGSAKRVKSAFRSAIASIGMTGNPIRRLSFFRSAAEALGLDADAKRVSTLFRSAIASIGVAGTATRGWIGVRSASASMSIAGTSNRLLKAYRSAAAGMGLTANAVRSTTIFRVASAAINIVSGTIIYLSVIRHVADAILSDLELFLAPTTESKTPSSTYKVNNYSTSEAILGANTSGKMVSATADNVDVLNTTGDAVIKDLSLTSPRLGTSQKIPKGYLQGGRTFQVTIYVLGRNTVLDGYLDEDGDSTAITELVINGITKDGDHCNYYIYDAMPYTADALMGEGGGVFAYRFVAARIASQSQWPSIKLIAKTASAPLTVNLTHPQIILLSTALDVDVDATTVSEGKNIESVLEVTMS